MSLGLIQKIRRRGALSSLRGWQFLRILAYRCFSYGRTTGYLPRLRQPALISGRGEVRFGKGVTIGFFPSPGFLGSYCHIEARGEHARISIGDNTFINNSLTIIAESTSVEIGDNCLIGPHVTILDSDFHAVEPELRRSPEDTRAAPIRIGENVFIGAGVIVLKGVEIGTGSVVAAGSVVQSSLPDRTLAGGNPAVPRRRL